jgi:hypothetical protein
MLIKSPFIITKLGNLDLMLGSYFKLCFIGAEADNLDANWGGGGYFELIFIMAIVGNLYTNIWGYLELAFVMVQVGI